MFGIQYPCHEECWRADLGVAPLLRNVRTYALRLRRDPISRPHTHTYGRRTDISDMASATATRLSLLLLIALLVPVQAFSLHTTSLRLAPSAQARVGAHPLAMAKKKGGGGKKGKKGGGNKKGGGFADILANLEIKPTDSNALRELVELAANTYKTRTGNTLPTSKFVDPGADVPKAVWNSKQLCVLVLAESSPAATAAAGEEEDGTASDPEEGADAAAAAVTEPVVMCTYANPAAAEAFGYPAGDGYKSLIDLPLAELSASVGKGGKYESGYEKKLARRAGAPLLEEEPSVVLRDVSRWTLEKMAVVDGKLGTELVGVAYCWESWQLPDGTICTPGGIKEAPKLDPAELQAAIDAQGGLIRKMKEEDGRTNDDEEVQDAVQELLRLKSLQ